MNVARIKDGIVVNIEVADEAWVVAHDGEDGYTFIAYEDTDPRPHIGLTWSKRGGFEQPPVPESIGEVSAKQEKKGKP